MNSHLSDRDCEKINKGGKALASFTKQKKSAQISKIRNERGDIMTATTKIHWPIRHYYKQLNANRLDNLKKRLNF